MNVQVVATDGRNLSRHMIKPLRAMNDPEGTMWPELVARRRDDKPCTVHRVVDTRTAKVYAWALTYPTPNLGGHDFHVYVDAEHRRNGYGTLLYAASVRDHGVVRTFAPTDEARNFYKALDNHSQAA